MTSKPVNVKSNKVFTILFYMSIQRIFWKAGKVLNCWNREDGTKESAVNNRLTALVNKLVPQWALLLSGSLDIPRLRLRHIRRSLPWQQPPTLWEASLWQDTGLAVVSVLRYFSAMAYLGGGFHVHPPLKWIHYCYTSFKVHKKYDQNQLKTPLKSNSLNVFLFSPWFSAI